MVTILQSLSKTVHLSLGIAILLLLGLHFGGDGFAFDRYFFSWLFRYLHVLTGIMWIGLLWYFNFVQIPKYLERLNFLQYFLRILEDFPDHKTWKS